MLPPLTLSGIYMCFRMLSPLSQAIINSIALSKCAEEGLHSHHSGEFEVKNL